MNPDLLISGIIAGLVAGLVLVAALLNWRQRLPANIAGRVKADIAAAMLRALLLLLAGLALGLGLAAGLLPQAQLVQWAAMGLVVIGGVGFVARVALYWLRIKPELDSMSVPVAPVSLGTEAPGEGPREERSSRADPRREG